MACILRLLVVLSILLSLGPALASAEAPLSMALDAATSLGRALAGFAESLDPYGFDPKILYSGSIDIENKLETASILMPPTAAVR